MINNYSIGYFSDNFIAKLCFFTTIFIVFFGLELPFTVRATSLSDAGTSNILNQIVYGLLFIFSVIFIVPRYKIFLNFLKKEFSLTLLMFWIFLSVFWSDFSFVSFKRYFQLLTMMLVLINAILFIDRIILFRYLKIIFYFFVLFNLIAVIFIPLAIDPAFNSWRGITYTKNLFGQDAIILLLFLITIYLLETKRWQKIGVFITCLITILFVKGSGSATSMISLLIIFFLLLVFWGDWIFKPLKAKYIYTSIFLPFITLVLLSFIFFYPKIFDTVTLKIGKDPTISGRTALWELVLENAQKNLFWGCGYGGYWVKDNKNIAPLIKLFNWLPNEAHNGYIDILNELGLIGIAFFIIFVFVFIFRAIKTENRIALIAVAIVLVTNYTESSLFKVGWPLNFMLILYYLDVSKTYQQLNYRASR